MKKNYFMLAAFATALAFTACSNEEEMPVVNGGGSMELDPESVIEIAISNTGTGTTRTARPVGSSEAHNNVDHVQLKVFNADGSEASVTFVDKKETNYTVTKAGLITFTDGANLGPNSPGEESHPNQKASIQVTGLTDRQTYTIVAYGYNGGKVPYSNELQSTSMYYSTGDITTATNFDIEEIFAGSAKATAQGTTKVTVTPNEEGDQMTTTETVIKFASPVKIELTRQVAGMLAYLKDVPAEINGKRVGKVTVEAIDESKGFYYPAKFLANAEFNGTENKGTSSAANVLTFTIKKDQKTTYIDAEGKPCRADTEGAVKIYDFTDEESGTTSQFADGMPEVEGIKTLSNTLFGARFLVPFADHVQGTEAAQLGSTLVVNLYTADDTNPSSPTYDIATTKKVKTADTPSAPIGEEDLSYYYDIRCNNFYSIGQKVDTDSTTGEEGDGDDDEAVSLISSGDINLLINDRWAVVHDMTLE